MRLGCCGTIDTADAIKAAGFDFLEVNVQAVLRGDESDETWAAGAPDPNKVSLPIEAANSLVPGHHAIVGPKRDLAVLQTYMQRVTQRARQLGITRLVFGSGGARKRPGDVDLRTADKHLVEFTQLAGDACGQAGVTLVIEHLNAKETNTINKLRQARQLAAEANHPAVAVLVDSYHYGLENESDQDLLELGDTIQHVHVAEPIKRIEPGGHGPGSPDAFDFEHFFCLLRKAGYDQRISYECSWSSSLELSAPASVALIRQAWQSACRVEC